MGHSGVAKRIDIPVQMVEVLGRLAGELEGTSIEAVILPLMPAWHKLNQNRRKRTWPAEMMVERFVEIIKSMVPEPGPTPIIAADSSFYSFN